MKQTDAKATKTHKAPKGSSKPAHKPGQPNDESMGDYFRGVVQEWHKISWPTVPQIWAQSIVVLVMVSLMTLGLWAIDSLFRFIIGWITPAVS